MTQQLIYLGIVPNDGLGTPLRNAGTMINSNFTELYSSITPVQTGNAGRVLTTNGTVLSWSSALAGTVTSVGANGAQGVSISGSPITSSGSLTIGLGAITPTSVAAIGAVTGSNLSGTNTGDQTLNGLLPVQTGNAGRVLGTDGTNTSWIAGPGSVAAGNDTEIQFNNSGVLGASPGLTWDGVSLSTTGNLAITGAGRRIVSDFSNVSVSLRTAFQTNEVNSHTTVGVIPNGNNNISGFGAFGSSDQSNATIGFFGVVDADTVIEALASGTGVAGPIVLRTGPELYQGLRVDAHALNSSPNVIIGFNAYIPVADNNGFLYIPSCTGTPTGTPTVNIGKTPIIADDVNNVLHFYSNGAWRSAGGTGTVTSVASGSGLTGGPVTTTGTISLDAASIASLALADTALQSITSLDVTTALTFTPYNATNPDGFTANTGTVTSVASGTGLTGGPVTTSGTISLDAASIASLALADTALQSITSLDVTTALTFTPYNATNPDGFTANTGTVTSVGISSTGTITVGATPVTTSGTITVDLADTAVTPGAYTNADITVDAQGRITSASSGSLGSASGVATLVAGSATVSSTFVTAGNIIMLTVQSLGTVTVPNAMYISARTVGTDFTITSADGTDTSTVAWLIVN